MIQPNNIFTMFVVQINYTINEAFHSNIKSLNDKGAREFKKLTSFQIASRLVGLQRAPLFINFKKSIMQTNQKENRTTGTPMPIKAKSIVKDIIDINDPLSMREDLREMVDAYFMFNQSFNDFEKQCVFVTYRVLSEALKQLAVYKKQQDKKRRAIL